MKWVENRVETVRKEWCEYRAKVRVNGAWLDFYVDTRNRKDNAWNHVLFHDGKRWHEVFGPAGQLTTVLRWAVRDIREGRFLNFKCR